MRIVSWLLSLILPVTLTGCAVKPHLHPTLPSEVKPVNIEWRVDSEEGKARVSMSWEDSQKFRVWMEDVKRYTLETREVVCYYRRELNEGRCKE